MAEFPSPGKPLYMRQLAQGEKGLMAPWSALAEVVKSGQPFDGDRFMRPFSANTCPNPRLAVDDVAKDYSRAGPHGILI